MNDKLQIAVRIKKTIIYIEKTLEIFPHKYIEIKSLISKTMYEMLEYIYLANINIEREKKHIFKYSKITNGRFLFITCL